MVIKNYLKDILIKYTGEYEIFINNEKDNKKYKNFPKQYKDDYLPKFIFAYYSGMNERLKSRFNKAKHKFHQQFLKTDNAALRRFLYAERKYSLFSRLGRSMLEVMEILSIAKNKGINIYAIKGNWQLDGTIQSSIIMDNAVIDVETGKVKRKEVQNA